MPSLTYCDPDLFIERVELTSAQADLILRRDGGWVDQAVHDAVDRYATDPEDYALLLERVMRRFRGMAPDQMLDIPDGTV